MLHFGAVDYAAAVWPEEKLLGRHEGGHTPFSFDLTEVIAGSEQIERRYEMDEVLAGSSLGSVRVVAC